MTKTSGVEALMQRIAEQFDALPRQQQNVARYVEAQRANIMLQRINEVAKGAGVHASAVVRFAQRFDYSGYSEMQAVFRSEHTAQAAPARSYQQRIRQVIKGENEPMDPAHMALRFIDASRAGLDDLASEFDGKSFEAAVDLLAGADTIYVVAVRRAFSIASYIAYALQHTHKRVLLVNGLGGMHREQMRSIGKNDVLIAISFPPYGKETLYCARVAVQHRAKVLAITESGMGPLTRHANVLLKVR